MSRPSTSIHASPSRRDFLRTSGTALAGTAALGTVVGPVHAAESNTIKLALIGCGGRGTGAAVNALSTKGPTVLWAMADVFEDRLRTSLKSLAKHPAASVDVPPERQHPGDGRVSEGHRFAGPGERGAADHAARLPADPPRIRRAKRAATCSWRSRSPSTPRAFAACWRPAKRPPKKNLKIAGGLMCRHYTPLEEAVAPIHDGAIGEVITCWAYREHGPVGFRPKSSGRERAGPPDPQLQQLHLAQRQLPPRLADPQPRRLLLGEGRLARLGPGPGRPPGPRRAGPIVRPLRRGIHLRRRHAAVRPGAAHRPAAGASSAT